MADTSDKINRILESLERLDPLPTSVARVLKASEDINTTGGLMSELIGLDQALAANVLQMANAAALGYGPQCSTLSEAVMRLGFKRIKTIVLGVGASGPLGSRLQGYQLGEWQLWNHSVATATAAQWLSGQFKYPNPEEAYVAGLLHDIGKLVLDRFILPERKRVLNGVNVREKMLCEIEEELVGMGHPYAGGLMAKKWNFPPILVETIQNHHTPLQAAKNKKLSAIINLANSFSPKDITMMDPEGSKPHPDTLRLLGINLRTVQQLKDEMDAFFRITPL